jgi:DNA-binding PucR family transcriptional regulator
MAKKRKVKIKPYAAKVVRLRPDTRSEIDRFVGTMRIALIGHATVDVMLGDVHHQAQVVLDHFLAGFKISLHHATGQCPLLIRSQQRAMPDFIQVNLGNVTRTVADKSCGFIAKSLFLFLLQLGIGLPFAKLCI